MTREQIVEYTKRCLEFLNYKCVTPDDKDFRIYQGKYNNLPEMIDANFNDKLWSDWNCIISVLKRIREIINTELSIDEYNTFLDMNLTLNPYEYSKEQVVQAINQFLIWYNENKNNFSK